MMLEAIKAPIPNPIKYSILTPTCEIKFRPHLAPTNKSLQVMIRIKKKPFNLHSYIDAVFDPPKTASAAGLPNFDYSCR